MKFYLKIIRNGFILGVLFFIALWATNEITWGICKSVIVFYVGYVFTELARFYNLDPKEANKTRAGKVVTTLVF
jgi:hypothetical protein